MRPGVDARPRRAAGGLPPGTDPVCLLITTVAVVVGLVAAGMSRPALPAQPPRPARADTAARGGSGPSQPAALASGPAMRLLGQAATASETVRYQGVELLIWWGPGGTAAAETNIWHRPGQEPALRAAAPGPVWPAGTHQPAQPATAPRMAAVLGLSPRLVSLLGRNYLVTLGGRGEVAGRPALLVDVRRPGGALAAQFWLDRVTKLPLRRQIFGPGGGLLGEDVFLSLSLARSSAAAVPPRKTGLWRDALGTRQLASLRARGWPLPGPLPGELALLGARESNWPSGPVVHLAYSDGLSMVSVFIQRGLLAPSPAGWTRYTMGGRRVYVDDDGSVAWSAHGFVFTVIAQAPARTVGQVVGALPHAARPRPPSLLARLRIGAHRLLSWLGMPR